MPATSRKSEGKSRGTATLSRQRVIAAALALADANGDFSMRALGRELRVDPMAVYRHFRDKADLLDAMVDAALSQLEAPDAASGSPAERLRRMCVDFRACLVAHPGVATRVSTTRPTLGPHTLALTDACVGLLREMGLDPREATRAFLMAIRFITGVVTAEQQVRADGGDETRWREELRAGYAGVPPEQLPHVADMATEVGELGFDSEFEYGLDLLIEGLVRRGQRSD